MIAGPALTGIECASPTQKQMGVQAGWTAGSGGPTAELASSGDRQEYRFGSSPRQFVYRKSVVAEGGIVILSGCWPKRVYRDHGPRAMQAMGKRVALQVASVWPAGESSTGHP